MTVTSKTLEEMVIPMPPMRTTSLVRIGEEVLGLLQPHALVQPTPVDVLRWVEELLPAHGFHIYPASRREMGDCEGITYPGESGSVNILVAEDIWDGLQIALEALTEDLRKKLVKEKYAPELETNDPAVITFTTAVAAQAVSELLHRLTGFMGESRRASELLMMFHDRTCRGNRQTPQNGCFCSDRSSWATGDDGRSFLNVTWPSTRAA